MPDYDVAIIGAGPGGYVAAIRASQLGLKTAVVERDELGGVCLNWGCIPSKALLRNAEILHLFNRAEEFGVSFDNLKYDYSVAQDRSRQVVDKLAKGVASLLRKNNVDRIKGEVRANTTPRHVPAKVIRVAEIPRTISGKIVELAVRDVIHGREVRNKDALANPEALDLYQDLEALKS